ncbi:MAG: DUF1343 domain-containing protein [Bdellovibrionales bacterium]|nr:DUF1343 domain-containing protein [Bdellovibrionales bacterium]
MSGVRSGLDILVDSNFKQLAGTRVGLICNPSAVDRNLEHAADLMAASENCNLVKLFAPEHGIRGALQDMEQVKTFEDPKTHLPVISLYGNSLKSLTPTNESLDDVDCLVFDIQDIGARYYTYAQTLAFCMLAASRLNKKVVVLDRPNPIDGVTIEGTPLTDTCRSFCGLYPVANRHGLTIGEIANMFQRGVDGLTFSVGTIPCDLEIIKMEGWKREMNFLDTGLPWVLPSPNMPTLEAALTYPGTCFFEGTNISEGRGTTRPFTFFGAPYIDGHDWREQILQESAELGLAGAALRPISFIPHLSKWSDKTCGGVELHVNDPVAFKPIRWTLAMICAAAKLYPENFGWRQQTYEFVKEHPAIDLLYGSNNLRRSVETKKSVQPLLEEMKEFENHWAKARKEYLLYS